MAGEVQGGQSGGYNGGAGVPEGAGAEGDSGGTDGFDYAEAFKSQQRELQSTREGFKGLKGEFEGYKRETEGDLELTRRLKDVFKPQEKQAPDPREQWMSEMDYYIAQGLEADKRGQKMPLTVNLAINHYKEKIANYEAMQRQEQTVAELRAQVAALSDPQMHINQRAYENLDTAVKQGLDQLYGVDPSTMPERRAIFNAVGSQLSPYINKLQKENPNAWDQLRRDPRALAELAQSVLRRHIPQKAQQMMAQQQLENTPMPMSELRQAFAEAKQIKDPAERERITSLIRQDILQRSFDGNGNFGGRR